MINFGNHTCMRPMFGKKLLLDNLNTQRIACEVEYNHTPKLILLMWWKLCKLFWMTYWPSSVVKLREHQRSRKFCSRHAIGRSQQIFANVFAECDLFLLNKFDVVNFCTPSLINSPAGDLFYIFLHSSVRLRANCGMTTENWWK